MGVRDGLLDTNIFIHAYKRDAHTDECVAFLQALQLGAVQAVLHPLIVHELTYAFQKQGVIQDRGEIAQYLRIVLGWSGIDGEIERLDRSLARWGRTPGLSFVDAYLIETVLADGQPVYTMNVKDFAPYGVVTPRPLPSGL